MNINKAVMKAYETKSLKEIAEPSGGKQYNSDPATIRVIYGDIATFF